MNWELQTLDRLLAALSASDELDEVVRALLVELGEADLLTPADPQAAGYTLHTQAGSQAVTATSELREMLQAALAHDEPFLLEGGLAVRLKNAFLRTRWSSTAEAEVLRVLAPRLEAVLHRLLQDHAPTAHANVESVENVTQRKLLRALLDHCNESDRPYLLAVVRDLSQRDRSHTLLQAVVDSTTDVVFVKDLAGRYLLLNDTVTRLMGRDTRDLLGLDDFQVFPPEVAAALRAHDQRVLSSGQPSTFEQNLPLAEGQHTFLCTMAPYRDAGGNVIGLVGVAKDITQSKALEEQLRQSQKMEAVGQLAGGVAHDFNNLLTVINSYSQMMLESGQLDVEMLNAIHQAGLQAADLTRRLLAYSRKQLLQPSVVDLHELLQRVLDLLRRLLGENIEVSLAAAGGPARVKVDVGQFEQAIVNLAVNARDAMPDGGKLTIGLQNVGDQIEVSVTDTGQGMDEPVRTRIFEPFFTTKEVGRGTGLGLSMVYGFVRQSGGSIEVDSQPGQGSTFRIRLAREREPRPSADRAARLPMPRGEGTVLLVEDEKAVRQLARRVLQSCGYRVLEAEDGEHGLEVAREHSGPLDLVVTDVIMPRMGGVQFAQKLSSMRPEVRVLFVTGYSRCETLTGQETFLQKPFSPYELAEAVHQALNNGVEAQLGTF